MLKKTLFQSYQREYEQFTRGRNSNHLLQEAFSALSMIQNEILTLTTARDHIQQENYFHAPRVTSNEKILNHPHLHSNASLHRNYPQHQMYNDQRFGSRFLSPQNSTENIHDIPDSRDAQYFLPATICNKMPDFVSKESRYAVSPICGPTGSSPSSVTNRQHGSPPPVMSMLSCESHCGQHFAPQILQGQKQTHTVSPKPIYMVLYS
jgi:hypothetical protein